MAWNDSPPTKEELGVATARWDAAPPSAAELGTEKSDLDNIIASLPQYQQPIARGAAGAGKFALENVALPIGKFIDRYAGAPTRAAVGAAQEGTSPLSAFAQQFGQEPELAPTGKAIAERAGVSGASLSEAFPGLYSETGEGLPLKKGGIFDPTASGAAGLGIDIGADITNLLPVGLLAKGVTKTAGLGVEATKAATKGAARATDLATGTKGATKTLETVKDVTSSVSKHVTPKQAENFADKLRIAKENDIPTEAISSSLEFGPSSIITRAERSIAEGPYGQKLLEKHNAGLQQIEGAFNRRLEGMAGGAVPDATEVGSFVRNSYDKGVDQIFGNADITYKKVQQYAPGLYIDNDEWNGVLAKLNGIEKYAKGLKARNVTKTQAEQASQLLRAVQGIRNTKRNFKQAVEQMQVLGDVAFKSSHAMADIPPDINKLRDLYRSLSEASVNTIEKQVSPQFAKELRDNNNVLSNFFKENELIGQDLLSNKIADEQVLGKVFANSKKANALQNIVGPENFNKIKAAYIKSLAKETATGNLSFAQLAKNLEGRRALLSSVGSPEEFTKLKELVGLGAEYGVPILSTSGTGASLSFKGLKEGVARGVLTEGVVSKLKTQARKTATAAKKNKESGQVSLDMLPDLRRMLGYREKPTAQRLKALQSIAPSSYNKEDERKKRRLKALGE